MLTSFLLVMLLFRAYVPVGFMPASGAPFLLELCPAASGMSMPMDMAMDMSMPAHHQHSDTHSHFEHCPFAGAAAGPISQSFAFEPAAPVASHRVGVFASLRFGSRVQRAHQPRGPPFLG